MQRQSLVFLTRLVLCVLALCWGAGLASAQMQSGGTKAQTGPYRSPQAVMQMRKMTMAQRQAAAKRNAERKAAAAAQKNAPNTKSEVKK